MTRAISVWTVIYIAYSLVGCGGSAAVPSMMPSPYPFITATPRQTPTQATPSPESTTALSIVAATDTVHPQTSPPPNVTMAGTAPAASASTPRENCRYGPEDVFLQVYQGDPGLPPSIGCPMAPTAATKPQVWPVSIEFQPFQRGSMLWLSNVGWNKQRVIYVLFDDQTYARFSDTYDPTTDPSSGNLTPTPGLFEPLNALGKLWRTHPEVQAHLGLATNESELSQTGMQIFDNGEMVYVPGPGAVIVFKHGQPGSWASYQVK